ncbi:MAG: anhydro-N-acetylmuramic acid kinase [Saprospiraceae bacterium]|nr:anhydro-N-acetylmuramic acid kinase [Saprospiraceae bacterium]
MNLQIEKLYKIASKSNRNIIGLMSGTSLDGLDIVYCNISGTGRHTDVNIKSFDSLSYDKEVKDKIRLVFAQENVNFPYLVMLNEWLGSLHAGMVNNYLAKNNIPKDEVDAIASHGQTVMHVPAHQHGNTAFENATLQIGDGDHIAVKTGIITISDFRQKHIAAGGEGAPLAVYGDYLIFSKIGEDRIMLNIGGISNFTYLPGDNEAMSVFVTDTGPGNTLMDVWMNTYFDKSFDENAEIARQGHVNWKFLSALKEHYFFDLGFPRTTGPEVFNIEYIQQALKKSDQKHISHENVMATLNRFSAETIAEAIKSNFGDQIMYIYLSGGGAHNPLLVDTLQELLPVCLFNKCDVLGIAGDSKEAVLFAVLANETLAGSPIDFGTRRGVPGVCMGKISFPV